MSQLIADDAHITLGRRFRTPAHPAVVAALGRAVFCFLQLEEMLTAILYEAGAADLSATRGKTAGAKEKDLVRLADRYRASQNGAAIAPIFDAAVAAFGTARSGVRNQLLHAHPFTAGADAGGNYLPALAYTATDGATWNTVARSSDDLLDLADAIELAITPLEEARDAGRGLPVSQLKP